MGIRDWMVKRLNPDAHQVTLSEPEEKAYYDEKRKVWVFPGDNPDELVKPIGPPPTALSMKPDASTQPAAAAATVPSNDPLAAMMAPPSRAPSTLRRPGAVGGAPRAYPPGGLPPRSLPGMPSAAVGSAPPQFAVFQPKAATTQDETKD